MRRKATGLNPHALVGHGSGVAKRIDIASPASPVLIAHGVKVKKEVLKCVTKKLSVHSSNFPGLLFSFILHTVTPFRLNQPHVVRVNRNRALNTLGFILFDNLIREENKMIKSSFLIPGKKSSFKLRIVFVAALLAATMGFQTSIPNVFAADVYVDISNAGSEDGSAENPYRSIMAAVNHSTTGDIVRVAPGVYHENVVMKDGVDLIGADVTTTVLDADGQGSVVETSNNAMLSGFTIRNGTGGKHWYIDHYRNGGGVKCDRKNTTIANNIIEANYQVPGTSLYGGGVFLWESTATVRNNVIVGNQSWYGSGIYTYGGSPTIINNTFVDNRYHFSWYSQTILCVSSPGKVENNILYGNDAGEIWNLGRHRATISYNNFWDNRITSYSYYHYIWNETITYENEKGDNAVLADPSFVDALSGDYHLTAESPCIDTGNPLYYDPDATRSDIGAFYFAQVTMPELAADFKPEYALSSKKANHGTEVSASRASDSAREHANENATFNRNKDADYIKVASADAILETDGTFVLDRAVKLDPGDYSGELPEPTFLVVIFDEYYPVVSVSEDRRRVQIADWIDPEILPEGLLEDLAGLSLPQIPVEFYQILAEVQSGDKKGNKK